MHASLSVWIFWAVVCLVRGDHAESHVGTRQNVSDMSSSSLSPVCSANSDFAYRLYKQLATQPDSSGKNVFYSPMSVTLALAALSVGAGGETHQQLFKGLGFDTLTQLQVDQAFHTLLTKPNRTSEEDMSAGTALFVENSFKPKTEFLEGVKQFYMAEGFSVDFTKTEETVSTINEYVANKTSGKIDKLVTDLDPSTVMYLISYVYYKGKWETQFDPEDTKQEMFSVDEQTKVPVQMMTREGTFRVYYDEETSTSVLRLPFTNSNYMLLLLPHKNLAELEEVISQNHVTKWLKLMEPQKFRVFLPKFSIKTSFSLKDVLSKMGMTSMFSPAADFSGISEGKRLAVSEVVHQASLDVDEAGATAAAATGVGMVPLSATPVLEFNRPFMVIIIEPARDLILFMGKITDPSTVSSRWLLY